MRQAIWGRRATGSLLHLLLLLTLTTTFSKASTTIEMTLKDLCKESNHIVLASVISAVTHAQPDGRRIYTEFTIEIIESLKGNMQPSERRQLLVYGGTFNGITTVIAGGPAFRIGEKSLLFLAERTFQNGQRGLGILGLSQGKFNIKNEAGTDYVRRDQADGPLKITEVGSSLDFSSRTGIALSNFKNLVRMQLGDK
jgi:hypothetical protein